MSATITRADVIRRVSALDKEWDIDRAIEFHGGAAVLATLFLARFVNRRFLFVTAAVAGFLLRHSLGGWAPQAAVLESLGFRSRRSIEDERASLLARVRR